MICSIYLLVETKGSGRSKLWTSVKWLCVPGANSCKSQVVHFVNVLLSKVPFIKWVRFKGVGDYKEAYAPHQFCVRRGGNGGM